MIRRILKIAGYTLLIIFILFSVLPYLFPVETHELGPDEKPFANSHFLTQNKTRVHYRVWIPDGKVLHKVFFIHGFAGSGFSFRKNIDTLVKQNSLVICLDLPAFGFSDRSDTADYSADNTFGAINKIMAQYDDSLKDLKWNFVGHSMGAAMAGLYASNYPQKINSLTLIDGVPVKFTASGSVRDYFLRYPPLLRWADVLTKNVFSKKEKFEELLESAYSAQPDTAAVNGYIRPFLYKNAGSAIFRMAATQSKIEVNEENLKKIPTLVMWGTSDKWLSIHNMKDFMEKYPAAKGRMINGAGHCPMETRAAEVNQILIQQITR